MNMRMIPLSKIKDMMCGWAGCPRTIPVGGDLLPGWRALVVTQHSLLTLEGVMKSDIDMVLCPEHTVALKRELANLLKMVAR